MMGTDFYGGEGCCLTCPEAHEDCLCYECKCRRCDHYDTVNGEGFCTLAIGKTWDDYESNAILEQQITLKRFGTVPINLKATFSNGTITATVYYANAIDIPYQIRYFIKEKFPSYRTLLLKKVFKRE